MPQMHVLHVFADRDGQFGNPVGIILDLDKEISAAQRQAFAAQTGFSETVFVDDDQTNEISIYTPQRKIAFAGHAVIGAVSFIEQTFHKQIGTITSAQEVITCRHEGNIIWIKAGLNLMPSWQHKQLSSAQEIETLTASPSAELDHVQLWAWIDDPNGIIRARTFAPAWGIPEDEANGSGSMMLAASLEREITIHHGKGSVIFARPSLFGCAEVGGRLTLVTESAL